MLRINGSIAKWLFILLSIRKVLEVKYLVVNYSSLQLSAYTGLLMHYKYQS